MRFRRKTPRVMPVFRNLRNQALAIKASDVGPASDADGVLALLMETGYPDAVATLVVFADGTTSLYFSSGGGIIGAGGHADVAAAAQRWVAAATDFLSRLDPMDEVPLPGEGMTQFVVVTSDAKLVAYAPEAALGEGGHPLSPLFYAAQDVITQIRLAEEAR